MIAEICNASPDKNMARVEEVDQARQHVPDHLSTIADDIECCLISLPARRVDIFRAQNSSIRLPHLGQVRAAPILSCLECLRGNRRSGSHRLEATFVAT